MPNRHHRDTREGGEGSDEELKYKSISGQLYVCIRQLR